METESINGAHEDIVRWMKNLKFKKKMFGGVREEDVLKKIAELNSLYEIALLNERARYDALLEELRRGGDAGNEAR